RIPATQPPLDGHAHWLPGGPGGCAQHQKLCVKQIVPGVCGGTCATALPTDSTVRRNNIDAETAERAFIAPPFAALVALRRKPTRPFEQRFYDRATTRETRSTFRQGARGKFDKRLTTIYLTTYRTIVIRPERQHPCTLISQASGPASIA